MLEDSEIKSLFEAESKERIESLQKGLAQIREKFNLETLNSLFRDAHTIKGSARMLGLKTIEQTAYAIENILDQSRKEQLPLSPKLISDLNQLCKTLQNDVFVVLGKTTEKDLNFSLKIPEPSTLRVQSTLVNQLINEAGTLALTRNRCYQVIKMIDETHEFIANRPKELMGENTTFIYEIENHLSNIRKEAFEDISGLDRLTDSFTQHIQKLGRIPLDRLFDLFPSSVEEMSLTAKKEILFEIRGGDIVVDKRIIDEIKDPLMHLLRNAIAHGIEFPEERIKKGKNEKGTITLDAQQIGDQLRIEVQDDGKGIDFQKIKEKIIEKDLAKEEEVLKFTEDQLITYICRPGFTTTSLISDLAGRGVGLDVVKKQIEALRGDLTIQSTINKGSSFVLQIPTEVMTTTIFLVKADDTVYGIPVDAIEKVGLSADQKEVSVPQKSLSLFLGNQHPTTNSPYLLLKVGNHRLKLLVDEIIEEQQVVITPFHEILQPFPCFLGASILKNGHVSLILNPMDMMDNTLPSFKKTILLVDDSPAILSFYKDHLESKGFRVICAVDGIDGLSKLKEETIDVVVSDLQMPRMDGFTFLEEIRKTHNSTECPFILVTSLNSLEAKKKALTMGANDYLVKNTETIDELCHILTFLFELSDQNSL